MKKNIPCRFFAQGRCDKGAACAFSHESRHAEAEIKHSRSYGCHLCRVSRRVACKYRNPSSPFETSSAWQAREDRMLHMLELEEQDRRGGSKVEPHLVALPSTPPSPPPRALEEQQPSCATEPDDCISETLSAGSGLRTSETTSSPPSLEFHTVVFGDEAGTFRANEEHFGWQGPTGTVLAHPLSSVQQADWHLGTLVVLLEAEDGQRALRLDGFAEIAYDGLKEHFKRHGGVDIRKHATLSPSKSSRKPASTPSSVQSDPFGVPSPKTPAPYSSPLKLARQRDDLAWLTSSPENQTATPPRMANPFSG